MNLYFSVGTFLFFSVVLLFLLKYSRRGIHKLLQRILRYLPKGNKIRQLLIGISSQSSGLSNVLPIKVAVVCVFISLLQLFFVGAKHTILYEGLGYDLDWLLFPLAYAMVYIITSIPSTPGKLGVFELAYLSVFHLILKVPIEIALALLVLERILSVTFLTVLGFASSFFLGYNISGIFRHENLRQK